MDSHDGLLALHPIVTDVAIDPIIEIHPFDG